MNDHLELIILRLTESPSLSQDFNPKNLKISLQLAQVRAWRRQRLT
jgi:hypothetical protein